MQSIMFALLSLKARVGRVSDEEQRERGATAVEYGLLVALIAAVIIATVATLGGEIDSAFQTIVDELQGEGD